MGFLSRFFGFAATTGCDVIPRIRGNGRFSVEVVGESHYGESFQRLFAQQRKEDAEGDVVVDAELVLDDGNPHDPKAVAVTIGGQRVGFLSRDMARDFRSAIKRDGIDRWTTYRVAARVYMGGEDERWSASVDIPEA